MNSFSKDHFSTILKYWGISFITGSISHGFFSGERAAVLAIIGIIFFIIATLLEKENKEFSFSMIFLAIGLSLSIGSFTGGLQHFLDSPERSLWITPLGFFGSIVFFTIINKYSFTKKEYWYAGISTVFMILFSLWYFLFIQKNEIQPTDHHQKTITKTVIPLPSSTSATTLLPPVSDESLHHGH